jgi:hypothetical protein
MKLAPNHGTRSAYINWRCRCELCKAANTRYHSIRNAGERVKALRAKLRKQK